MRILSFEIQDGDGWTLEPTKLDAFNLLVGVSGAGKTRIVNAIARVCAIALGTLDEEVDDMRGARFAIDFEHEGLRYRWEAELDPENDAPLLRSERITREGQTLVERTPERFVFEGRDLPRLDRAKSAVATLKEDPAVEPLHGAFSRCFFMPLDAPPFKPGHESSLTHLEKHRREYASVADLGADLSLSLHHKADLLAAFFPEAFTEIDEAFREAFPSVEKLGVQHLAIPLNSLESPKGDEYVAYLVESEAGVELPVPYWAMSSGMQRYLSFLIHFSFAPRGTIVIVDELESSLGINCLPAATRFLLRRAPDLQLILTSHHPYIIEHIPPACWKIVTRKGSHVRVLDAGTIPALDEGRSHLDRFTRLINLPEYEQGIQA